MLIRMIEFYAQFVLFFKLLFPVGAKWKAKFLNVAAQKAADMSEQK